MGNQPRPGETISADSSNFGIKEFMAQPYLDITNGFPFATAQQLRNFLWELHLELPEGFEGRLPILATTDGKIIIGYSQHRVLFKLLGANDEKYKGSDFDDPHSKSIEFTTSIENMSNKPSDHPYIKIDAPGEEIIYCRLGTGSTYFSQKFTPEGKAKMKEIFEKIPGVEFVS